MAQIDIPVFVVSLKGDTQRRVQLKQQLDELGIPFEFVDAFDARTDLHTLDESQVNLDPDLHLSPPEYGCSLSHAFLYKRIVDEQIPYSLILEDDAIPLPTLVTYLEKHCYKIAPLITLYHGRSYVKPGIAVPLFDDVVARPLNLNTSHTVAYTISLAAATALRQATMPVCTIPDWPLEIASLNAHIVRPVLVQHPPHEIGSGLAQMRKRKPKKFTRYFTKAYYRRKWIRRRSERIEPQLLDMTEMT